MGMGIGIGMEVMGTVGEGDRADGENYEDGRGWGSFPVLVQSLQCSF